MQMASLVFRPFSRTTFRRINRWCADTWWGWCVIGSEKIYGVEFHITGDDVPMRENALLVVNHQTMSDIPPLMKLGKSKDRLGDMKYFIKKELKWVPGMGWGLQFLDAVFIDRQWTRDEDTIRRTFARLVDGNVPVYLVSFVEGTRLTAAKLAKAKDYAREHRLPVPRHTLVPRTKGFVASIQGLRGHLDAVYDLTLGYDSGVPTLWQYLQGLVRRIHLHVRRIPIDALPERADELRQWLLDRWHEKDEMLEHFYTTGSFVDDPAPGSE
jgi:1-acyl-sn-glycerol-3-phosphate acyltransferase